MAHTSAPTSDVLEELADGFAAVMQQVDSEAEHGRWKPGIGPFEEERQVERLLGTFRETHDPGWSIETEVSYPDSGQRCDLVVNADQHRIPIEAKLLRFRLDNGNIDSNCYMSVFSPFPEESSSSLLTDVQKLRNSTFGTHGGVLGLYYEKEDEPYEQMQVEKIARKFAEDAGYWYDIDVTVGRIAKFSELRHPHHQQGAVVAWEILG